MKWLLKILSLIAIKYLIWLKNWEKNSNEWNWQLTVLFSKWVFTFDLMLWLQSLLSLWNQGLSPLKSLVAKSIYLFLEFKNWGNIFSPSNSVTFYLSFVWTCLVSIGFVKYIPKSLFLRFSSFQTVHNLVGQRRPLLLLAFIPPELTLSSSLQWSLRFITDSLCLLAESKQHRDCGAQLLKGSSFNSALILILTHLVLLWKSCLPQIRWINKWYLECRVHKIGCRNLAAKI